MPLRKARSYSKKRVVPFTRVSKKRQKSYIKTVPPQKIMKFNMGNYGLLKKGKLPHKLTVRSAEKIQIRHNALESSRQYMNRQMHKEFSGQFYFIVVPYPHHIQRENKMIAGAGADRLQTGMQQAYGKSSGKAALLKKGSRIFEVYLRNPTEVMFARKLIKQIKSKLPGQITVEETIEKK